MAMGDERDIPEIKTKEARTAIAALVGGRRKRASKCKIHKGSKKSKRRMQKIQKIQKVHKRRTYKRK
jgi:coenzyme F420-reducing hydrogenase delta subunit